MPLTRRASSITWGWRVSSSWWIHGRWRYARIIANRWCTRRRNHSWRRHPRYRSFADVNKLIPQSRKKKKPKDRPRE